ncbi:MAG: hypothetical protein PHP42_01090 [Bacteroidota bacterium]|nr:hypothetical protein [Bacteroidota bacterium]
MKKFLLFLSLGVFGCGNTADNAPANIKKGDEFYAKKEYEVAEYYYEKIPDDSPFYLQAQRNIAAIEKIKEQWADRSVPAADLSNIIVTDHSFNKDFTTHIPIHRLLFFNRNKRNIEMVKVTFSYQDGHGSELATITTEIPIRLKGSSQNVAEEIKPGIVSDEFVSTTARIVGARYE